MKSCLKYLVLLFCLNFIEGSFRCDYNYSVMAKGWFKLFVVPATWTDARLRCALEGAVLASPTTLEIQAEMTNIVLRYVPQRGVFTGIHATLSQGDYQSIEGTSLAMIPVQWAPNEPDNVDNKESCLILNRSGKLSDHSCQDTRPYICYRPNSENSQEEINECGTVDPEYQLNNQTNKCYKFHLTPRNFSRASFACTAEGGHLAIINSDLESAVLKEIFSRIPRSDMLGMEASWKEVAFIGFYDWGERGDWRTIHGQTLSEAGFSKFSAGEPNNLKPGEFCGSIYRSGLLNDLWCHKAFAFICEKSPYYPAVCHHDQE